MTSSEMPGLFLAAAGTFALVVSDAFAWASAGITSTTEAAIAAHPDTQIFLIFCPLRVYANVTYIRLVQCVATGGLRQSDARWAMHMGGTFSAWPRDTCN